MILEEYSYLEPLSSEKFFVYISEFSETKLYIQKFLNCEINTISSLVPFKTSKQLSKFVFWAKMQMIRLLWVTKSEKTKT